MYFFSVAKAWKFKRCVNPVELKRCATLRSYMECLTSDENKISEGKVSSDFILQRQIKTGNMRVMYVNMFRKRKNTLS